MVPGGQGWVASWEIDLTLRLSWTCGGSRCPHYRDRNSGAPGPCHIVKFDLWFTNALRGPNPGPRRGGGDAVQQTESQRSGPQQRASSVGLGLSWVPLLLAAGLTSALLWFPSAAVGIGAFEAAGQYTYLTFRGLALPALVSVLLLAIPAAIIFSVAAKAGRRRAWGFAGGMVIAWQFGWVLIALFSGNSELIAWPYYAAPSEPEPWNPPAVFASGLAIVGLLASGVTVLMARERPTS